MDGFNFLVLMCTLMTVSAASVLGTFKVESPEGVPVVGMALEDITHAGLPVFTDAAGCAVLEMPSETGFVVKGTQLPAYQDLVIFGATGSDHFNYTTYMGTRLAARALARVIGKPYDPQLGYVVVGMDNLVDPAKGLAPSNLIPAVGSSASVRGVTHDDPFIFDLRPTEGNTITATSGSFVTFPNAYPNSTGGVGSTLAMPPDGQHCYISPGMQNQSTPQAVAAFPDSVSVVSFICTSP